MQESFQGLIDGKHQATASSDTIAADPAYQPQQLQPCATPVGNPNVYHSGQTFAEPQQHCQQNVQQQQQQQQPQVAVSVAVQSKFGGQVQQQQQQVQKPQQQQQHRGAPPARAVRPLQTAVNVIPSWAERKALLNKLTPPWVQHEIEQQGGASAKYYVWYPPTHQDPNNPEGRPVLDHTWAQTATREK